MHTLAITAHSGSTSFIDFSSKSAPIPVFVFRVRDEPLLREIILLNTKIELRKREPAQFLITGNKLVIDRNGIDAIQRESPKNEQAFRVYSMMYGKLLLELSHTMLRWEQLLFDEVLPIATHWGLILNSSRVSYRTNVSLTDGTFDLPTEINEFRFPG